MKIVYFAKLDTNGRVEYVCNEHWIAWYFGGLSRSRDMGFVELTEEQASTLCDAKDVNEYYFVRGELRRLA